MSARRPTRAEWLRAAQKMLAEPMQGICGALPRARGDEWQERLNMILDLGGPADLYNADRGTNWLLPLPDIGFSNEPRVLLACFLAAMNAKERAELGL